VSKPTRNRNRAKFRPVAERLEARELLTSTFLEGLAENNSTGSALAPVGNIFDDAPGSLVGTDFVIGAPGASGTAGEAYVVFGHVGLNTGTVNGCVTPLPGTPRGPNCELLNNLLTTQRAVRILGDAVGDRAGFSVAGVGDVIGDSRPDLLIGAPFASSAGVRTGRAYLIGGDYIANVIGAARAAGGATVATIDLGAPAAGATFRVFNGQNLDDEAGNTVAGVGNGLFMVSAPVFGAAPFEQRGKVYIFGGLRGVVGPGAPLVALATVVGPSNGAHLGGVPAGELFSATGFKGQGISPLRNPALIPVASELPNDRRYRVISTTTPDVLLGAPDACTANDCTPATAVRHGRAYLLSGAILTGAGGDFDLSVQADLQGLSAIIVQGGSPNDRLGATVSSAGDFDGDFDIDTTGDGVGDGESDFMFAAPGRDVTQSGITEADAGEVYLIFGREVNTTPFPNGACQGDPGIVGVPQTNFRQCRDAAGNIVPLTATNFVVAGNLTGLTLRGATETEQLGTSLSEAGNFSDPTGRGSAGLSGQVGVTDILLGAPFHNVRTGAVTFLADAGRAYGMFGSRDYRAVSGQLRDLELLNATGEGQIFNGRFVGDNYGIAVAAAGNAGDPTGFIGDDVLFGARNAEAVLGGAITNNVGEVELLFGSTSGGGGGGAGGVVSLLPFVQPGTFGPQIFAGGYWSFVNQTPPAGSVTQFPLVAGQLSDDLLFPPFTPSIVPAGAVGPFIASSMRTSTIFLPDRPIALVDRSGNLNVYDRAGGGRGVNVTATARGPRIRAGAVASAVAGATSVFALDQAGHLVHHRGSGTSWSATDLTQGTSGPGLTGNLSVRRVAGATDSFVISGRALSGGVGVYVGNDSDGWRSGVFTPPGGVGSSATVVAPTLSANYVVGASGRLIEYMPSRRTWRTTDISASAGGPPLVGDVAANIVLGGPLRAVLEVFARSVDGRLIRFTRAGRGWQYEDISGRLSGAGAIDGSIIVVPGSLGQRFIYAQSGSGIVEVTGDNSGWRVQELPAPNGTATVLGPIAALPTSGNSRVVYGYEPGGSVIEFSFSGAWTARSLSNDTTALGTLLDRLADLGVRSR
jgi:hypothetical protein